MARVNYRAMSGETLHWSNINPKVRNMIMLGLGLGMLVACLDATIVGPSLGTITKDLGGGDYTWIITGYMLTETAMIPIAGKLSDKYGRKPLFLIGMAAFVIGSTLCGFAGSITELTIFRAIQGIGAGTVIPVTTAAVADLYAPTQRGKIQGMLGALFAVAMAVGPLLGGSITESIGWRYIFMINIPIGIVALAFTAKQFPSQDYIKTKTDYIGMALLTGFLFVIILLFKMAGASFAWLSIETMLMIAFAAGLLLIFMFNEKKVKDPVLNPSLFKSRLHVNCFFAFLIYGMALMGTMTFLPMFMQNVVGVSVSDSGAMLMPFVFGAAATSMTSGFMLKKTGYTPWLIVGPIITFIGLALMSTLGTESTELIAMVYMFITGLGMGCFLSIVMIAAQNGAKKEEMGMVTSSVNLFRAIGSTVAVGIFTAVANMRINTELNAAHLDPLIYGDLPHNIEVIEYLDVYPAIADLIRDVFSSGVTLIFLIAGILSLTILVTSRYIKGKPQDEDIE